MKLAVVIGQIVCTVRHPGLESDKLLLVEMIDRQGVLTVRWPSQPTVSVRVMVNGC